MSDENLQRPPSPEEIALQAQRDANNFEYALEALRANERDRAAERELVKYSQRTSTRMLVMAASLIVIITVSAFWFNKETFLYECLKALIAALSGGGIGYSIGLRKSKRQ